MEPIYLICLHSLTVNDIKVTHFCKLPNQNQWKIDIFLIFFRMEIKSDTFNKENFLVT